MGGRRAMIGLLTVVIASSAAAHRLDPDLTRFEFAEEHMGTRFRLVFYAADEQTARTASRAAFHRVAELNGIMSDYLPESELMRLCKQAGGDAVPVSADLFAVLARSAEISRITDGTFDVTVSPVVRMWRRARRTRTLPDQEQLSAAKALVDFRLMTLDPIQRTVRLAKPGMQLDLGGIGKGYAADAVQAVLQHHGITRALVAAGGDIAVSASPPGKAGWTIGVIAAPDENKEGPSFMLHHAGVSTSGDIEQFVEIGGKRYSHIVDPRSGKALTESWQVTVIAPNATTSDAMTKVLCILGPDQGIKSIEGMALSARMVRKVGDKFDDRRSPTFPK